MTDTPSTGLKRSLGLATVVSLGINGVIGQGIFLLPGKAAAQMGPSAILALMMGGLLCFMIALCFAEVSSRFDSTGGAYVYAREAFGDFVGFEV
ncbi:MAG: APC family permease, partial [Myxococcota bacterium]